MVILPGEHGFICLHDHLHGDALTEQHQCAGIERGLLLIAEQLYEVLQVRILRNLFHDLPVRVLELRLDDERTQGHAQGLVTFPVPLENSPAYLTSYSSHGMLSAIFTHWLSGFIWPPIGWLKSRKECWDLSVGLYIAFTLRSTIRFWENDNIFLFFSRPIQNRNIL